MVTNHLSHGTDEFISLFKQLKYTNAVLYKSGNCNLTLGEEQFVSKCSAQENMWMKVKGRQMRVEKTA
jgi:hypothetical protein